MSNDKRPGRAIRVAILTVSDSAYHGEREDISGPTLRELVEAEGIEVVDVERVPDEKQEIAAWLRSTATQADVLLTCGGTGFSRRDVTPEATGEVIDFQVPGIAEALRAASLQYTPHAMLSRAVAGVIGSTLVVNLPGSPAAVAQQFEVLAPVLVHATALLHGETAHNDDAESGSLSCS